MYGGFLYRLNYEEYQKRQAEIDEKLIKLSEESENEDIVPLDEVYIVRFDTENNEEFAVQDSGYFVLLIGDYNFDIDYAEKVIYGLDESYARHIELKKKEPNTMTASEMDESFDLLEYFTPYEAEEVLEIAEEILDGEADYGEVIKRLF